MQDYEASEAGSLQPLMCIHLEVGDWKVSLNCSRGLIELAEQYIYRGFPKLRIRTALAEKQRTTLGAVCVVNFKQPL